MAKQQAFRSVLATKTDFRSFPSGLGQPLRVVPSRRTARKHVFDEVRIRQQELPNKGIKTAMHFFLSILQCLARFFFGSSFAKDNSPCFHGAAEAVRLQTLNHENHWPGVGWMKVRLVLEELCGVRRPCVAPLRTPDNLSVGPRADIFRPDNYSPASGLPSYLRHCFSPPDFPGM